MACTGELQAKLDACLACAEGDVVVWHDPAGAYSAQLADLVMPPDVELIVEDELAPFALKVRLSEIGPDERLVVYRARHQEVAGDDWIANIEARAEALCFDMLVLDDAPAASDAPSNTSTPSAMIEDDGFGRLAEALDQDWYGLEDFRAAVRGALGEREGLSDEVAARACGFTLYKDCALRRSWASLSSYYSSLLQGLVVARASIPESMRRSGTFRSFLYQQEVAGKVLDYDDESWITADGLVELGVAPSALEEFARAALQAERGVGRGLFTVLSLKCDCPDLRLFELECSPAFYESVLCSQRNILSSILLSRRRVFMEAGARYKGRDLLMQEVHDEGSLYVDDLVGLLAERHGVVQTRAQVIALVKQTDMHYERSIDRIYIDRNRFIEEVE